MLRFKKDVMAELRGKGYTANKMRNERIFGGATMNKMRHRQIVSMNELNRLCGLLEQQPGELIEYISKEGDTE
jgi:putative transcriptional regulator